MAQKGSLVGALIDAGIISAVAVRRVITVINELSAQNLWFIDILIKYAFAIIDQRMAGADHIITILQCHFGIVLAGEPPNGRRSIALDAERREVLGVGVHDARSRQSGIFSTIDVHGITAALIKKSIKLIFVVLVHASVGLRDHIGGGRRHGLAGLGGEDMYASCACAAMGIGVLFILAVGRNQRQSSHKIHSL